MSIIECGILLTVSMALGYVIGAATLVFIMTRNWAIRKLTKWSTKMAEMLNEEMYE